MSKQKTLASSVEMSGVGLHTGKKVTMTFHPAEAGHGFKFKRTDLENQPVINALASGVTETARGTTIGKGAEIVPLLSTFWLH